MIPFWVTEDRGAQMRVTWDTYRNFGYHREKSLKDHTDEELTARIFHLQDIYRGMKGPLATLKKLEINMVWHEQVKRKAEKRKQKGNK